MLTAMDNLSAGPQRRRHDLTDWLRLHGLDAKSCLRILDTIQKEDAGSAAPQVPQQVSAPINLDTAWLTVARAIQDLLPGHRELVENTFEKTAKIMVSRKGNARKALTIDKGPSAYPAICYSYTGVAADLLIMAHEFGHAVQIRASGGKFMPPALREVCAFLGERALLKSASAGDSSLYAELVRSWQVDDQSYLRKGDKLRKALARPDTPYDYAWNYPIARHVASRAFDQCPPEWNSRIFAGELALPEVLKACC